MGLSSSSGAQLLDQFVQVVVIRSGHGQRGTGEPSDALFKADALSWVVPLHPCACLGMPVPERPSPWAIQRAFVLRLPQTVRPQDQVAKRTLNLAKFMDKHDDVLIVSEGPPCPP